MVPPTRVFISDICRLSNAHLKSIILSRCTLMYIEARVLVHTRAYFLNFSTYHEADVEFQRIIYAVGVELQTLSCAFVILFRFCVSSTASAQIYVYSKSFFRYISLWSETPQITLNHLQRNLSNTLRVYCTVQCTT